MTSYARFPRSNVAGNIPTDLDPGSFAVNWADKKVYVGGPNREAQLFSYLVGDHSETRSYRQQEIVHHNDQLWRCNVSFVSPGPFNESQWTSMTDQTYAKQRELSGSTLISGGTISLNAGVVQIEAGTGVVMTLVDPNSPIIQPVTWPSSSLSAPLTGDSTYLVGVDGSGAIQAVLAASVGAEWYRGHIPLGHFNTDQAGTPVIVKAKPYPQHQIHSLLWDFLRAFGAFKITGLELTVSFMNQITMSTGEVFWPMVEWEGQPEDPTYAMVGGQGPLSLRRADRTGFTEVGGTALQNIDPAQWDNGGVLQAVPDGQHTIQYLFLSPNLQDGIVMYGQQTYPSASAAFDDIAIAYDELVRPLVLWDSICLGAVITSHDGVTQTAINSNNGFTGAFGGGGSGGGDTSQFLLISGTRAMEGNLNLDGNSIVNAIINGVNNVIIPEQSNTTGVVEVLPVVEGELFVNTKDLKVYVDLAGTATVVADRTALYSDQLQYGVGDLAIQTNALYRCTTAVTTPEAFDPAKWQVIGAAGGGLDGAIIEQPLTPSRNTIDLTVVGDGSVSALKTVFDQFQSVDMYEFSPDAKIDRFGIPTGAFGEAVFRVAQASHPFTVVGQIGYFDGANWQLADDSEQAKYPQGVISQIVDINNFLIQTAGRINNLNPAAFKSGAITPGTYYYASDEAGKVTSVVGPTPIPVFYTVSATSAIVKLTGTVIPTVLTPTDVVDIVQPVGSTFITNDPADPSLREGWQHTTWELDSIDRAIVGAGGTYTGGDTFGGNVTLAEANLPPHAHVNDPPNTGLSIVANGNHNHNLTGKSGGGSGVNSNVTMGDNGGDRTSTSAISFAGSHGHSGSVDIAAYWSQSTGSGTSFPVIQPSKAFYVWRRLT